MAKQVGPEDGQSIDDLIAAHRSTEELQETISFLIHRREMLRDLAIQEIEEECQKLLHKLQEGKRQILIEELDWFKVVLRLHKRLIEHEQSGH